MEKNKNILFRPILRAEEITPEEALREAGEQRFAYVLNLSDKYMGLNSGTQFPVEEIQEARFFGENGEIHFYRDGTGRLKATRIRDGADEDCIDTVCTFPGGSRYPASVYLREYIAYDNDGQAYICGSRLMIKEA